MLTEYDQSGWGTLPGMGAQYFIGILFLPKNKVFYFQDGKNK